VSALGLELEMRFAAFRTFVTVASTMTLMSKAQALRVLQANSKDGFGGAGGGVMGQNYRPTSSGLYFSELRIALCQLSSSLLLLASLTSNNLILKRVNPD
jgi:hypothetical protein